VSDEIKDQIESALDNRSEADLRQLAVDYVEGKIFTSAHVQGHNESVLLSIFIVLLLGVPAAWVQNAGLLFEYMDKRGPVTCNGWPTFFSVQKITNHDMNAFNVYVAEYREMKKKFFAQPIPEQIHIKS